jgi:hypothetical protein
MVFGIKFNLFTYHYHYVTWNISASWKFFYRSWFQHYTVTVWDAGTCLSLLCRHVHSREKHISPLWCPSICLLTCISMTSSGCIFVKFDVGAFFNICDENWNLINIGQKYWEFTWRPKNILLPGTSVCHNSIVVKQSLFCWKWQVSCNNEYSLYVLWFIACREYGMSNCIYCK